MKEGAEHWMHRNSESPSETREKSSPKTWKCQRRPCYERPIDGEERDRGKEICRHSHNLANTIKALRMDLNQNQTAIKPGPDTRNRLKEAGSTFELEVCFGLAGNCACPY